MSRATMLTAVALLLLVAPAVAHETGVVRLSAKQVESGGGLTVRGERMPRSGKMRLELRGTLATLALGEVTTDTAGGFEINIVVPETTEPGNYKLVVLAADGDVTARADLVIVAATPEAATDGHAFMAHGETPAPEATDRMMSLDMKFTTAEMSVISVFVLTGLVGGLALLRRERST